MNPGEASKNIPRGLKPAIFLGFFGTAKAVPFQNIEVFPQAVKPCPFKSPFMQPVLERAFLPGAKAKTLPRVGTIAGIAQGKGDHHLCDGEIMCLCSQIFASTRNRNQKV